MTHHDHIRWTLRWLVAQRQLSLEEARSIAMHLGVQEDWDTAEEDEFRITAELDAQCALDDECTAVLEAAIEESGVFQRSRQLALSHRLRHEQERARAPQLYEQLCALPEAQRRGHMAGHSSFHTRALVDLILNESKNTWPHDIDRAETINRLALDLLPHLDADRYGREVLEDLSARAWAYLGNVLRRMNRWAEAETAFQSAEARLLKGTGDPLMRAMVKHLQATLLYDLRRLPDASNLMAEAIAIYQDLGETHLAGRVMISRANLLKEQSEPKRAIEELYRALPLIDPEVEPRLELVGRHNLMDFLCDLGRAEEAGKLLEKHRGLYLEHNSPMTQLRLRWLEAKIAMGSGDLAEAEIAYNDTRQGFEEQRASYEAALATLDLAAVYALQGRTTDLKRLAEELFTTFQSHDIHREALAAIILFRQTAEMEAVTLEVARQVARQVERSQYLPPDKPS